MIAESEKNARESAKIATAEAIKSGDIETARHNYAVMLELKAKAEDKPFFEKYGEHKISTGGWLGDAEFTVEEFYQAILTRLVEELG